MKSYRPTYFLGEAFKGMWRNKRYTIATIFVLIGCLIIIGCSYVIYENVDYNMEKFGSVKEITIFLDREVSPERAQAIGNEIKLLDNVVAEDVRFISKEEALSEEAEVYAEYVDLYDVLEGDNPFRDSYVIPYYENDGYSTLMFHLENIVINDYELPDKAITLLLKPEVSPERAAQIFEEIKLIENVDFENARYISESEALKAQADMYAPYFDLYSIIGSNNPFSASIVIPYTSIGAQEYAVLVQKLNEIAEVDTKLSEKEEITLYIKNDVSDMRISQIIEDVKLINGVDASSIKHVSKDDILAQNATIYGDADIYALLNGVNPFEDTVTFTITNGVSFEEVTDALADVSKNDNSIREDREIAKINDRSDLANTFENLKDGVLIVIIVFMAILLVVCIFVIVNTIGLAVMARSEEIVIMRYIGATGWFIAMPFVIEGIVIGLVSSISAYFAQAIIYNYLEKPVSSFTIIEIAPFSEMRTVIFVGFLVVGLLCGIVGSIMSMKKYIKA